VTTLADPLLDDLADSRKLTGLAPLTEAEAERFIALTLAGEMPAKRKHVATGRPRGRPRKKRINLKG
jgi:hypothetical protein